jgi:hypothetical protein
MNRFGPKNLRRCAAILGRPVYAAWGVKLIRPERNAAHCQIGPNAAVLIDHKRGEILDNIRPYRWPEKSWGPLPEPALPPEGMEPVPIDFAWFAVHPDPRRDPIGPFEAEWDAVLAAKRANREQHSMGWRPRMLPRTALTPAAD